MELNILRKTLHMPTLKENASSAWLLTPLFGAIIFIALYIIAALLYPGGSQVDAHSKGFSLVNNYWCNLLNEKAMNGENNPAAPIALAGMVVLCFTLSFFWYIFPRHVRLKKYAGLVIQISGLLAMLAAVFMFTGYHDTAINIAGFFGVVALCGTFAGLYKSRWYWLFIVGIFNLVLIALNNYVYYTKELIIYLPVVQKISFLSFLIWLCWIDIKLFIQSRLLSLR